MRARTLMGIGVLLGGCGGDPFLTVAESQDGFTMGDAGVETSAHPSPVTSSTNQAPVSIDGAPESASADAESDAGAWNCTIGGDQNNVSCSCVPDYAPGSSGHHPSCVSIPIYGNLDWACCGLFGSTDGGTICECMSYDTYCAHIPTGAIPKPSCP